MLCFRWQNRSSPGRCQPGLQAVGNKSERAGGLCPQPGARGLRPSNTGFSRQQKQCAAVPPARRARCGGEEGVHSGSHAAPRPLTRRSVSPVVFHLQARIICTHLNTQWDSCILSYSWVLHKPAGCCSSCPSITLSTLYPAVYDGATNIFNGIMEFIFQGL